jgi:hypothetical protein
MSNFRLVDTSITRAALAIAAGLAMAAAVGCGSASLTPAEQRLIGQADAICADSRGAIQAATGNYSEEELVKFRRPDYAQNQHQIRYATALAETSTSKVERLAALKPPAGMRQAFERYIESERQVYYDDVVAVGAAHSVHIGQYIAALARHRRHEQIALELAADAGFEDCARSG